MRIGTRSSRLALAQAELAKQLIEEELGIDVDIISSSSLGDQDTKSRLTRFRGQGVFTSGLELQLLDEQVDVAVHSLKDLPVEDNEGLRTIAYLTRHHPGDSIIVKKEYLLSEDPLRFKPGMRFATGSPRRQAQLMDYDNNALPVDIRGNVETRLSLLNSSFLDAVIMATAVFERIELKIPQNCVKIDLPLKLFPSAAGQGIIAIQIREGTYPELELLNDKDSKAAANFEREILDSAGGGCELSLGINARRINGEWMVSAARANEYWLPSKLPQMYRFQEQGKDLGELQDQVRKWFATTRSSNTGNDNHIIVNNVDSTFSEKLDHNILENKTIFIARGPSDALPYQKPLERLGATVLNSAVYHYITNYELLEDENLIDAWDESEWLVISSQRTEDFLKLMMKNHEKVFRIAVTGPKTAAMIRSLDLPVHVISQSGMSGLQEILSDARERYPGNVLYLSGKDYHAKPSTDCTSFPVYQRQELKFTIPSSLDYIIVFSANSARYIIENYGSNCCKQWIAIGPTTGQWLKDQGLNVIVAEEPTPRGIVQAITTKHV